MTFHSQFPTTVNYAAVMGLKTDTNIDTNQFSQLALVFYVTYLAFELPTGYLMQRLPTARYLGANGKHHPELLDPKDRH
jgi:fucose permease